ncbi:MAG TPA: Hpt domain-containing protein [Phycisphaerales bacterium]|nr:Hpt domain-containing protein [Phycisphaerales bacterium]
MDRTALDRLDRLGGPGFASRIIGIFLTEVPRRLDAAGEALAARDADVLANAVHSLISSAGNVGAPTLADLARAVEAEAEAARWDILPARLEELRRTADAVGRVLERERERRG